MKRFLSVALSAVLILSAAACTPDETPDGTTTTTTTTADDGTDAPTEDETDPTTEEATETEESEPEETETEESETDPAGETRVVTGYGEGFGGEIQVDVTLDGDTIVAIEVVEHSETPAIADPAIETVIEAMIVGNSTDVDSVSGATYTVNGMIDAVNNAIDPEAYPTPAETEPEETEPAEVKASDIFQGFGVHNTARLGPGTDDTGTPVYSVNQVFAHVLFDGEDRIAALQVDQLEYATPNYDGEGMPHFTGFPGQSYNYDEDHDEVVDGVLEATEDSFVEEIEGWVTKRDRGDDYVMGAGTWAEQMDHFEALFVGMTVDEVEAWFEDYTSDVNGRPLKAEAANDEDQAKYDALSDDEQEMLLDVTSGATMSLNDSHGDIIGAIRLAFENRELLDIESAVKMGQGFNNMGRLGPGSDDTGTGVYSVNQVFANSLFDEDGRLVALHVDQLEFATPNYDGEGMPHFTGFPGQSYNYDEDHDEVVDSVLEATEDTFVEEVEGWATKRERGDDYVMGAGTWAEQMDRFEELFIGMTADEIAEWFDTYTSDVNGRPLKEEAANDEDQAKYDDLSDEDKEMLADLTSGATMSLNDSHGDIIAAIVQSFENSVDLNLVIAD